jgi:protein-tyrosine-phosphatase
MLRVLFVCVENATRSQMAEAFARMHGAGLLEAWSAGSKPSGSINPRAVAAMKERGYDLTTHRSKSLAEVGTTRWDYLVTMGCGDACPWMPASKREDWELPDPHLLSSDEFLALRDEIERRVLDLIGRMRAGERAS